MLSSGVETQPVPLDTPMSAGAQELCTKLPLSVSPELPEELEPRVIPDAKLETSSSLGRTLPLEPQRTHVENFSQDTDPMGDREEPKHYELVADHAAGDSLSSGVLKKENAAKRGEQEEEEETTRTGRAPQEGVGQGQEQPSPAAVGGARGSCQVDLGKQLKQDLSQDPSLNPFEDEPHHTEENQGNVQVTTETLPKPTEEGQGMKVNGTKMISNAEHRNNKVSKSLLPGCIDCPDVDKIMSSGEVSETSTLVSLEPLSSVEPGLTKAPSTEKECETSNIRPLWLPAPEDNANLPLHSREVLSRLSLDHEAIDNHHCNCVCDSESSSKTSIPQAKSKEGAVLPLEADPQGSCFSLSLSSVESGSISLDECGSRDDLQKMEKLFQTREVLIGEGSASRLEEDERVERVKSNMPGGEESIPLPLKYVSEQKRCAPDSCHTHSSSPATQGSLQQENSPSEIQENFKKHKGKRVTCPCNKYHDEDSLEESYSLAMQNEESERTISEDLSVLGKNIDIQNSGSLISNHSSLGSGIEKRDPTCSVPDEPLKTVNKVSEVNSVLPQLWTYKKCDLTNQPEAKETIRIVSGGVTLFMDEQRIASNEQNEFASYSAESSEDKGKRLCFLSGKMSFEACDHKEATAPQELSLDGNAEDLCEGTSGISQQQASSVGEDEDKVLANHQPILAQMRNGKYNFHPDATTCHASSQNHDVSAKAGSFNRVPSNVVTELAAMSDLDKEVAELTEETPDVEHESAQSQRCCSCYHRVHSTPEGEICSEGIIHISTTSPEAENQSVLISEDMLVPREPHYPGTKNGLVESIRSVRHPSGENELFREEIQGSLEKEKIRNEMTSCSLLSRALNNSTLALSHVTPGNFKARSARKVGLEENKLRTHSKEAALPCESHPSEHSILGSNLSSNIPSPKELKNLSVNTEHPGIRIIKQADGTNQGLNCQSDLNNPIEYWSESKSSMNKHLGTGILEVQHANNHNRKNVAKPNKGLSSSHEELLVKDLSDIQPSYSLPKKNIFESSLGNEKSFACRAELAHLSNNIGEEDLEMKKCSASGSHRKQEEPSLLQQDRPLRSDQPQEEIHVLSEGLNDQDSILPCVSDSFNMRSLKTMTSCKGMSSGEQRDHGLHNAVNWESKKLCQDRETHGPVGSLAHGMRSVTNHEPNIKLSDTVNVLLESIHCGTTGRLGPQTNYTFDNEESLEVYSKEHMLESTRTTPLLISFQENSSSGSDGPLGEKAETKPLPESGDVKVLPEILKSSTLKTKVKKNPPGRTPNVDRGDKKGTPGTFKPNSVSSGSLSFELNPKNKMNRRETEEHPGTSNDLKIREESEGKTLKGDGGDKSSDAHRPHFKRKKICGETEAQTAQTVQGCKCLKGGREGMQPKKRGISSQQKAPLNAKPFIRPTVGPSSQDLTRQSCLKGYACKQNTLKDITRAVLTKDDSEAGRQTLNLLPDIESSLDSRFSISAMISQDTSGPGCDKIQDTFAVTPYQRKSLPLLKKGLSISYHEPIKTGRQMNDVQKWILLKNASETISVKEHKALSWSSTAPPSSSSVASHMPKPKAMRRLLLNSARLQKPTKESALLNKLSILARKLLATSTATHDLGSQPHSAELLPVAGNYKRLRFKKLQDESSYNMMQLNLHVGDDGCNKTLDSQTLALYPLEALRVGFLDLMNRMPSLQFNAQIFPLSFHINVDSELTTDSMRIFSEHCSPPETASGGDPIYPPQPPKWTFSFHMSQASSGIATFREDTELGCELLSHPALQTLSPRQAPGSNAITKVRADCSVLGLHTVLALSSPGCYRIWTRRRSLSSHLPTIQRLFLTQFTQGFKGLRLPASLSNSLFPPLPYSVGRVLSIWSQHGPSACPFEITTLHSKHSKWPPTLGIRNSHAILPHVPLLGQEATTARTRGSPVRPGSPFSSLAPKSCLAFEPVVSVLRLSASDFQIPAFKELRRVPSAGSSQHSSATQKEIEPEKRPKKVSQIRIRKTIPRPDPNLTPMGLPRPKRLKKKEFSLEEIYTNKNYKSPPTSRCLETIFEEPKERNGALISVSQQKRKRVLEFQDFTVPRKRRNRGKIKAVGSFTRAKKAALQSQELDALLIQKLMDLEAFLAKEGEEEPTSSC